MNMIDLDQVSGFDHTIKRLLSQPKCHVLLKLNVIYTVALHKM